MVRFAASQLSWCCAQLSSGAWVVNGTCSSRWSGSTAGETSVPGPTGGNGCARTPGVPGTRRPPGTSRERRPDAGAAPPGTPAAHASVPAPRHRPPVNLPVAVGLPVPFPPQAPLGNWAARQHTCEEASLTMVDRSLHGDHSGGLIDPATADATINQITAWKPAEDLTPLQVGQVAQKYMGWAYKILPSDRLNMKQQLALGRPLIFGVRTHGLGNPNYPRYRTHY